MTGGIGMLSMEDQLAIEARLKDFLQRSESQWSALLDKGGNLFAQSGETNGLDLSILSALAAGSFAATRELARRVGEEEFAALYHEGKGISILMSALEFDCLLITVFTCQTNVGLVRFYAQEVSQAINSDLHTASQRNSEAEPLQIDSDFDSDKAVFS